MKCEICHQEIKVTRNEALPVWRLQCACLDSETHNLERGIERHQMMARGTTRGQCCGAKTQDGTIIYHPGGEGMVCSMKGND